ncbi:hypothetical protein AAB988_39650, partial [Burkholderia contaminans]|uniref:hypothetical protein n=1 Tax=Burkholderia contaminans TaxID=488447 RepID=UPI0031182F88
MLGSIPFFAGSICHFGMEQGVDHGETAAGVRFPGFIALQNSAGPRVKYRPLYGVYRAGGIVAKSAWGKSRRVNPRTAAFARKAQPGGTRPAIACSACRDDGKKRGAHRDPVIIDIRSFEFALTSCACSESTSAP